MCVLALGRIHLRDFVVIFWLKRAEYEILEEHFVKYDDHFEYGCQLPAILLRYCLTVAGFNEL